MVFRLTFWLGFGYDGYMGKIDLKISFLSLLVIFLSLNVVSSPPRNTVATNMPVPVVYRSPNTSPVLYFQISFQDVEIQGSDQKVSVLVKDLTTGNFRKYNDVLVSADSGGTYFGRIRLIGFEPGNRFVFEVNSPNHLARKFDNGRMEYALQAGDNDIDFSETPLLIQLADLNFDGAVDESDLQMVLGAFDEKSD